MSLSEPSYQGVVFAISMLEKQHKRFRDQYTKVEMNMDCHVNHICLMQYGIQIGLNVSKDNNKTFSHVMLNKANNCIICQMSNL